MPRAPRRGSLNSDFTTFADRPLMDKPWSPDMVGVPTVMKELGLTHSLASQLMVSQWAAHYVLGSQDSGKFPADDDPHPNTTTTHPSGVKQPAASGGEESSVSIGGIQPPSTASDAQSQATEISNAPNATPGTSKNAQETPNATPTPQATDGQWPAHWCWSVGGSLFIPRLALDILKSVPFADEADVTYLNPRVGPGTVEQNPKRAGRRGLGASPWYTDAELDAAVTQYWVVADGASWLGELFVASLAGFVVRSGRIIEATNIGGYWAFTVDTADPEALRRFANKRIPVHPGAVVVKRIAEG